MHTGMVILQNLIVQATRSYTQLYSLVHKTSDSVRCGVAEVVFSRLTLVLLNEKWKNIHTVM